MLHFFSVQSSYDYVEIALYNGATLLSFKQESKLTASRNMIFIFESLLEQNNINLDNISFIAANCGPAPFTSLRAIIATVNALGYAKKIPLFGVNALEVMIKHAAKLSEHPIVLLNAYNNDCYFGFQTKSKEMQLGCKNIEEFFSYSRDFFSSDCRIDFFGNVAQKNESFIKGIYPWAQINQTYDYALLDEIAMQGLEQYQSGNNAQTQLQPLYLKQFAYKHAL